MNWLDRIKKGMVVRSSSGRELGPVTQHEGQTVIIDGGKDVEYVADYGRIDDIRDGSVWLKPRAGETAGTGSELRGREGGDDREVRMQLVE